MEYWSIGVVWELYAKHGIASIAPPKKNPLIYAKRVTQWN